METQQPVSQETSVEGGERHALFKSVVAMLVSLVSVSIAVFSFWIALDSNKASERVARVNAYIQLREYFNRVTAAIPGKYYDAKSVVPKQGSEDRRTIQNYWYFTFDEWYVSTQLNDSAFQQLWTDYYQHVIGAMLDKPVPRAVVCDLIKERFSQNDPQRKYANVLEDLYKLRNHGKTLCQSMGSAW